MLNLYLMDMHINDVSERDRTVEKVLLAAGATVDTKMLKRLHHLYGHTSSTKLLNFLKNAGVEVDGFHQTLESIEKSCKSCQKSKKRVPRPKFSIPRADSPNKIVSIDLKHFSDRYICYLVDMFSRLTVGKVIPDKSAEQVVNCIVELWIPHYGVMSGIHSDIGGEMSNDVLEDVASKLGVKLTTTAAYSPHQNGINERNHCVVDLMVSRMLASDQSLSVEMALLWALNAKNSLENCHGFSPFQLHIGYNPRLPSVTRDGPPSYDEFCKSGVFARNINAMHLAREEFVRSESSASLQRALKSKIFPRGDGIVEGDWIYFKKSDGKNRKMWRGPSKVVSVNGKKLFIDQGARLGTVNRDDAVLFREEFWSFSDADTVSSSGPVDLQPDDSADVLPEVVEDNPVKNVSEGVIEKDIPDDNCEVRVEKLCVEPTDTLAVPGLCKGDMIEYVDSASGQRSTATVISRAGKKGGKYSNWWNISLDGDRDFISVDVDQLQDLRVVGQGVTENSIETSLVVMIPRYLHSNEECVQAKEEELQNWDQFGTYEEVEDVGQPCLRTNWILVRKADKVKARLCVRGDLEDTTHIRSDSPTVCKENVKLFYCIAVQLGWRVQTADIKAAFLQGASLDRDVYLIPPKEKRVPGTIWKMVKRAYGFVDASRGFYLELEKALTQLGCTVSKNDPAIYMYRDSSDRLAGLILTHVDDLLHGFGCNEFIENIMLPLKKIFTFGKVDDSDDFMYVGMHIKQEQECITVDQDHYVQMIDFPDIRAFSENGDANELVDEAAQNEYRSIVGRIGWIATSSRPDLSHDHVVLSTKLGKASARDMKYALKVIKKLKSDTTSMRFVKLGDPSQWCLEGFGDAGFKSLPDKVSSCGGHVLLISNRNTGKACVLTWKAKKLKRVVSSSTAAEALAANDTLDEMVYVKSLLGEILGSDFPEIPLSLHTDCANLHDSVMRSTLADSPRLRTDVIQLQESLASGELKKFEKVAGKNMIADCLTKIGAPAFSLMNILRTGEL